MNGEVITSSAIEVEEAAAGKVDKLLALAVEVEGDLLSLCEVGLVRVGENPAGLYIADLRVVNQVGDSLHLQSRTHAFSETIFILHAPMLLVLSLMWAICGMTLSTLCYRSGIISTAFNWQGAAAAHKEVAVRLEVGVKDCNVVVV